MKTKLLTLSMMVALLLAAITRVQAQGSEAPCLPYAHGLLGDQSAMCGSTQTLELSAGWNWVSFFISFDDAEAGLLMLEEALDENGLMIKSEGDFTMYYDGEWGAMGDLEEIHNGQMYMIQVAADCTIELQGSRVHPEDCTITIKQGWNWIVFPSAVSMNIEDAFAEFGPEDGDQIKGKGDFSMYYDGEWGAMGDLVELTPGQGFMYFSNSSTPKTLVFK